MKPRPRIRKTVKWAGAVLTVALSALWLSSGSWMARWEGTGGGMVVVGLGRASVADHEVIPGWNPGFSFTRIPGFILDWRFTVEKSQFMRWAVNIPIWAPALLSLVFTAAAWRLDTLARRRARVNLCPKCHYDRTGLAPQSPCPECGTPPTDKLPT